MSNTAVKTSVLTMILAFKIATVSVGFTSKAKSFPLIGRFLTKICISAGCDYLKSG